MLRPLLLVALVALTPLAYAGPPARGAATTPSTGIDPAFEADIQRLLALSGSVASGQQVIDQLMGPMRQLAPELPEAFWEEARAELRADELTSLIVPIWAKHYSHDDVKALIAFYESPVGQKMVAVQPAILAEAMQAGRQWGEAVGMRIMLKVQARQAQER